MSVTRATRFAVGSGHSAAATTAASTSEPLAWPSQSRHYACVSGILPYIFIGTIAVLGVAMSFVAGPRCQRRMAEWATQNNLQLQGAVRRRYTTGPWGLWGTGRGTRFFEVTVVDAAGTTRRGWVRIGAGLAGIGTGKLDIRWDE
jgi:hypothetical protein